MTKKKTTIAAPYTGERDKRLIEKKLREGELKAEALKGYLASLPDVSDNAEPSSVKRKDRHGID